MITLASRVFESYSREGPFLALQDFGLDALVGEKVFPGMSKLEIDDVLDAVPGMLIARGVLAELPSRKIYLGAMRLVDIKVEKDSF
ncbi:hypothetical protein IFT69_26570 [Pseudomonas putida]|nr:hypothetical protein [Pseudomonas putida]